MAGEVQLNDVAEIIMGQSPPGSTYNESGVGLPFFQGVRDFNYRHPSIRVFCSEPTRIALPGDILFSVRAPIGRVNIAEVECSIGRGLSIIRARSHADRKFIEFALRNMEQQWQVIEGGGSVFGNATRRDLATLSLPWPGNPLEREAIGYLLGALDDKIELNRKMNQTLEEMARAIFKSWFVDFDPVRAKAAGQQPPGLKPEIAALFPDTFEPSELGEIPKGWRVGVVGDIAKQAIGGQWGSDNTGDGLVPAICLRGCDIEDLRSVGYAPSAPVRFVKPNAIDARLPTDADVLIAASGAGPCGRPLWCSSSLHGLYEAPVIYSNFVKRLTTPSPAHAIYLDRMLIRKFEDRTIHDYINGTSVPNLDATGLLSGCPVLIPSDGVLRAYSAYCQPMFSRLYSKVNVTLARLRDALLPKLISGELRVPDAERFLKERGL